MDEPELERDVLSRNNRTMENCLVMTMSLFCRGEAPRSISGPQAGQEKLYIIGRSRAVEVLRLNEFAASAIVARAATRTKWSAFSIPPAS
jgi:hypothetical protein